MCFGGASPALSLVPEEEYEARVEENLDQCIVDDKHFFIRGHIELKLTDANDVFIWSVWVSLTQLDEALRSFCPSAGRSTIISLIQKYRERYAEIGYCENTLYSGVPEAIDSLRSAGLRLGVCTSKRKDFAEKILSMFHLDSQFSFINGGDVGIEKQEQLCLC